MIRLRVKKEAPSGKAGTGADGMHDWELAGNQGVKTALDAELALVVGGEVTKSRN